MVRTVKILLTDNPYKLCDFVLDLCLYIILDKNKEPISTKLFQIMSSTREKGIQAENIAIKYLVDKGYKILQRNWYFHRYELDVIAQKDKTLAIIEIKSLLKKSFREPYQAVNWNKQQIIIAAANAYLRKYHILED